MGPKSYEIFHYDFKSLPLSESSVLHQNKRLPSENTNTSSSRKRKKKKTLKYLSAVTQLIMQ
jgi:hypothetical protein